MNCPLVSVLLPVYNGEKFIGQALQSILDQTFRDFELFVVDDVSTDRTRAIVDNFQDERIKRIYTNERLGLVRSLNFAASQAQGKYLARMDADDVSHPDRFERQVAFLEAYPEIGVLGTSAEQTDSRGRVISLLAMPETHELIFWRSFFGTAILHPTVMMRVDVFQAAGGYDPAFVRAEDTELWNRLLFKTKFANLHGILHQRRLHGGSLVNFNLQIDNRFTAEIRQRTFLKTIGRDLSYPALRWFMDPFHVLSGQQKQELISTFHALHRYMTRTFNLSPEVSTLIKEDLDRQLSIVQHSDRRPVRKFVFRLLRDILPITTRHRLKQSRTGLFLARRI